MKPGRILQVGIAVAVVAVVVARSDPAEAWAVMRATDPGLVVLAAVLNLPVAVLTPLRSHLVFRRLGFSVPPRLLVPTTVLGFVAGGLTPGASGEVLRAAALRAHAGVPVGQTLAVVVFERTLAVYLLGLSAAVVAAVLYLPPAAATGAVAVGVVASMLPWAAAAATRGLLPPPERVTARGPLAAALRYALRTARQVRGLLESPRLVWQWSAVTGAIFALIALQYWLLARAVAGGIGFGEAWIALGVSTVAAVLTLVPLGLGVLDASLAATLHRLGMTLEQGGVVAVLVRAAVTLPLVAAASACYVYLERATPPAARAEHGRVP